MQSRNQFVTKNKDFTSLVNNNIRNTLLLNNITPEDYVYYKDKFFEKTNNYIDNGEHRYKLLHGIRRITKKQWYFHDATVISIL